MPNDLTFDSGTQTRAQRVQLLAQMARKISLLRTPLTAREQQVQARYLAGTLTWAQVCQELGIRSSPSPASRPAAGPKLGA